MSNEKIIKLIASRLKYILCSYIGSYICQLAGFFTFAKPNEKKGFIFLFISYPVF